MKINKDHRFFTPKKLLITLVIIVLGLGSYVAYAIFSASRQSSTREFQDSINYEPPTDEQKEAGDKQKEETISKNDDAASASNNDQRQDIKVSYTALNQADGQLLVRALIDTVTNDGVCALTLTKGDVVVTKTAGTQSGPSSSTCKGFNVLVSELSSGEWTVQLQVEVGTRQGKVLQKVTVQ